MLIVEIRTSLPLISLSGLFVSSLSVLVGCVDIDDELGGGDGYEFREDPTCLDGGPICRPLVYGDPYTHAYVACCDNADQTEAHWTTIEGGEVVTAGSCAWWGVTCTPPDLCEPLTAADCGQQCGEFEDGCGGTYSCNYICRPLVEGDPYTHAYVSCCDNAEQTEAHWTTIEGGEVVAAGSCAWWGVTECAPTGDVRLDPSVFDWRFYINHHEDLCTAGVTDEVSAQQHWLTHGINEGRQGSPYFHSTWYIASDPALGAMTPAEALLHYLDFGQAAGDVGVPNGRPTVPQTQCGGFLDRTLYESSSLAPPISYAYAPALVFDGNDYHAFYCSTGFEDDGSTSAVPGWDMIRHSKSSDGGVTWSAPEIALRTSDAVVERAVCDPNIIKWNDGFYYMYYTGNEQDVQSVVFLARTSDLDQPFEKLTGFSGDAPVWSSEPDAVPHAIIRPQRPHVDLPENSPITEPYGAGQSTAIVDGDTVILWYTDLTQSVGPEVGGPCLSSCLDDPGCAWVSTCEELMKNWILRVTAASPWGIRDATPVVVMQGGEELEEPSVEIRYDRANDQLLMISIARSHNSGAQLERRTSTDMGLNWSAPVVVCDAGYCMPDYAHNPGVAADPFGNLPTPHRETLVGFGAERLARYTTAPDSPDPLEPDGIRSSLYVGRYDLRVGCDAQIDPVLDPTATQAATELPGWPASRVADGDLALSYSSDASFQPQTAGEWLAFWFADGAHPIQSVSLYPRRRNEPFVITPEDIDTDRRALHFPSTYTLLATNAANTDWEVADTSSAQPLFHHLDDELLGLPATVEFAEPVQTHGFRVDPSTLTDHGGNGIHYFQLAEVEARLHRTCRSY